MIDDKYQFRPGPNTKTIEFDKLWDVFTSDDESKLKDIDWVFNQTTFLDKKAANTVATAGQHVGYCSFPRCGNSFLRKYLTNITGIETGSDNNQTIGIWVMQNLHEFAGESIVDESTWIRKSHAPIYIYMSYPHK